MDTILYRLRYEPALVLGAIASIFSLISTLPAGATWASIIPVVAAAILRQFVSPGEAVQNAKGEAYCNGFDDALVRIGDEPALKVDPFDAASFMAGLEAVDAD